MLKNAFVVCLLASCTLLSACASVAVTNDKIAANTGVALGLDQSDFTITDRLDSGVKTTYNVKTKSGQKYSCYVTGVVSMTGRNVSDAICNKAGAPARNALLDRANKQ